MHLADLEPSPGLERALFDASTLRYLVELCDRFFHVGFSHDSCSGWLVRAILTLAAPTEAADEALILVFCGAIARNGCLTVDPRIESTWIIVIVYDSLQKKTVPTWTS